MQTFFIFWDAVPPTFLKIVIKNIQNINNLKAIDPKNGKVNLYKIKEFSWNRNKYIVNVLEYFIGYVFSIPDFKIFKSFV